MYRKQGGDESVYGPGSQLTIAGGKIVGLEILIRESVPGADASTASNFGIFFIAPFAMQIASVREVHSVSGTDAGAVTLDIEKLTGTQALDAGVSTLSAPINLKGTANTVVTSTLGSATNTTLATGDRLALKDAGVLTSLSGVTVMVELRSL